LLLDAGYDDADWIARCTQRGMHGLVPLSKAVGKSRLVKKRHLGGG
jgi:hypothetical protein